MFERKQSRDATRSKGIVAALLVWGGLFGGGSLVAQNPDYILDFDSGSGPSGGSAVVTTQVTIGNGATPSQGLSYGVCHDFTEVQPVATSPAADFLTVNFGGPADFSQIQFEPGTPSVPGGLTHGVVVCLLNCTTLPSGATTEILEIEYELIAPAGTTSTLEYCEGFVVTGFPTVSTIVVVLGQAIDPTLGTGTIDIVESSFVRGDTDANGLLEIGDGITLLDHLFNGQSEPPCRDAADSNDDGILNVADAVYHFFFLFGAVPPLAPWPNCGTDPSSDLLDCDSFPPC